MMRAAWVLVVLLVGPAFGFDSVCFVETGSPCKPGPQAARSRWLGPSDEHRALFEFTRIFGGLPADVSRDFTLPVFTSDEPVAVDGQTEPSLEPVNFFDAVLVKDRVMSVPEFAELPDHAFALWDWARGLELCPLDAALPAAADPSKCHEFESHMGAVNSNHFVPQAQYFYGYYHQLALDRAGACAAAESRITSRGGAVEPFRPFLRACEAEALVLEATGQHFLEDAWSTGHMWERWGSPDLADFPTVSDALLVAMTSGLVHGAKAVLEGLPVSHPDIFAALAAAGVDVTQYTWADPLCAPHPEVRWVGPGQATPAAGAGDLFLNELLTGQGADFPAQYRQLFSCATASLRAVYQAAGAQHGPLGALAGGLAPVDPTSDACFGQRATNRAMARGIGLDYTDPSGVSQRISLGSDLASLLIPALSTQVGATITPATLIQFRLGTAFLVTQTQLRAFFDPDATDLAEGGLGTFLGVDRNLVYVNAPLAPYVDPPLPWPPPSGAAGADAERASWLARTFHRAHALEWCNRFRAGDPDFLDVEALRSKVETLGTIGAPASQLEAACAACGEFAARHLRVGRGATDYDTAREPLCHFLADDPASAQYVYKPGSPSDTVPALAESYCGCGLEVQPSQVTLAPGATQRFEALRFGQPTTAVTWAATGGAVDTGGIFRAGNSTGTFEVRATSTVDGRSSTATVVVTAAARGRVLFDGAGMSYQAEAQVGNPDGTLSPLCQDRRVRNIPDPPGTPPPTSFSDTADCDASSVFSVATTARVAYGTDSVGDVTTFSLSASLTADTGAPDPLPPTGGMGGQAHARVAVGFRPRGNVSFHITVTPEVGSGIDRCTVKMLGSGFLSCAGGIVTDDTLPRDGRVGGSFTLEIEVLLLPAGRTTLTKSGGVGVTITFSPVDPPPIP